MRIATAALAALAATGLAHAGSVVIDFEDGMTHGWSINGLDWVTPNGGNPGGRIHWDDPVETFGISARTSTNAAFIGDYTARGPVTLSIDVFVEYIAFFGQPVTRDLVVEFRDYDNAGSYPYVSVWTNLGTLEAGQGWRTFTVDILDPNAIDLPAGWGGTGDEDQFGKPIFPANRTFADVMASVDEIVFTTFVPGYFYGFTNFDVSVDNISIRVIPAPGAAALFGLAGLASLRRRR